MDISKFPMEFVKKHCPKVLEARDWRKEYKLPKDDKEDESHAECAFNPAGVGLQCENCYLYIHSASKTRSSLLDRPADRFHDEIKKFYDEMDVYEKYTMTDEYKKKCRIEDGEAAAQRNIGAFI